VQGNSPRRFFERQMTKNYQAAASGKRKCIKSKVLVLYHGFCLYGLGYEFMRPIKRPKKAEA
jgi:hypothetical protein